MKEIRVVLWDDLHVKDGQRVEAQRTTTVRLGNREAELDLTDAHYQELKKLLAPWLGAGRKPGDVNPGTSRGRRPKAYYDGLKALAAERGIELRTDDTGKTTYPDDLRRDYEESLIDRNRE